MCDPHFLLFPHESTYLSAQSAVCRGVGPPGAQVSLEQQAYMLLTEPERQTMAYYLQEYQEGHIGVEPLAMALFELFNTHAKVQQGDLTVGLCGVRKRERYLEPVIQKYHVKKSVFLFFSPPTNPLLTGTMKR